MTMVHIDKLREAIPDAAKDIRLNLQSVNAKPSKLISHGPPGTCCRPSGSRSPSLPGQ
jgi:hypothetical protein